MFDYQACSDFLNGYRVLYERPKWGEPKMYHRHRLWVSLVLEEELLVQAVPLTFFYSYDYIRFLWQSSTDTMDFGSISLLSGVRIDVLDFKFHWDAWQEDAGWHLFRLQHVPNNFDLLQNCPNTAMKFKSSPLIAMTSQKIAIFALFVR